MYITDSTSQLRYIWLTIRADGGVLWQDLILAVEDEPPSSEGVHEPLAVRAADPRDRSSTHGFRGRRPVGRRLAQPARRTGRVGERQQENHRVSDIVFA